MAKTPVTDYAIMKALFPQVPPTWDKRISFESQEYWNTAKTLIASANFQPVRNEIFENLINRIALTKVHHMVFNNPLKMFKRGELAYGDTVQEIATDVIQQHQFEGGEPDQFAKYPVNAQAAYHRVNRQVNYRVTIDDPRMRRAFIEEGSLVKLVNEIIAMMGGSNEIDEYIYTKKLFAAYFDNKEVPVRATQIIKVPDLTTSRDQKDINKFIEQTKLAMRKMVFPNRDFTSAGLMSQTSPQNMTCFLSLEYSVVNEVYNIANAFNPEYLNLQVPIVGIDKFENDNIVGVILDSDAVSIYDNLRTVKTADNALGLYRNHFYHVWQTYFMSPFKNVIFLVK